MSRSRGIVAALISAVMLSGVAEGAPVILTFAGYFNDSGNSALVGSDLGAAGFADDNAIANNVALYDLTVPANSTVTFASVGYSLGGAEPYFSLFAGTGNAATFLDSNYYIPAIDFSFSRSLNAGSYRLALGVWLNMSFAENNPDPNPTLGDGFTGLGVPMGLGDYYYELTVTLDSQPPRRLHPSRRPCC